MDPKPEKPGGRPRKDTTLRSEWLRARVTTQEKHRAEQLMRDAGKTQSDFVRDAAGRPDHDQALPHNRTDILA